MAEKGLVMVYSGHGKGKTTAALGLALRSVGHGRRVLMIQFMKGDPEYGEVRAAGLLPGFEIVQKGLPAFVERGRPKADDLRLAREGLELARQALAGGDWDLVILDEINVALDYGLLTLGEVISAVDGRRAGVDVVLTGRGAHPELVKRADMVSEILEIKHHFHQGVQARKGIEF